MGNLKVIVGTAHEQVVIAFEGLMKNFKWATLTFKWLIRTEPGFNSHNF